MSLPPSLQDKHFNYLLLATNENSAAAFQNPLGGALHHEQVAGVAGVVALVDRHLVLVGGVEGDLAHFLVPLPDRQHVSERELHALEQGGL